MHHAGEKVDLIVSIVELFPRAEQQRGGNARARTVEMPPEQSVAARAELVTQIEHAPSTGPLQSYDARRVIGPELAQFAISATLSGKVELAQIQRSWRRRKQRKDLQSITALHIQQVAIHGELAATAGGLPLRCVAYCLDGERNAMRSPPDMLLSGSNALAGTR